MFRRKKIKGGTTIVQLDLRNDFDVRFLGHMLQEAGYTFKIENGTTIYIHVEQHKAVVV